MKIITFGHQRFLILLTGERNYFEFRGLPSGSFRPWCGLVLSTEKLLQVLAEVYFDPRTHSCRDNEFSDLTRVDRVH